MSDEGKNPENKSVTSSLKNSLDSMSEQNLGMLIHLGQLLSFLIPLSGLIIPIVVWQLKKNDSAVIDQHGKNVVNWIISAIIYVTISGILTFVLIGFIPLLLVSILCVIYPIIGGIKANEGEVWPYPGTIKFIK